MEAVSIAEAARQLKRKPVTIRGWLARGAPCASPGEPGRGRGALVVVEDLERWRAREAQNTPDVRDIVLRLAELLRDYHRAGDHRLVGLRDDGAEVYLAALFEYVALRLGMPELELDDVALFPKTAQSE